MKKSLIAIFTLFFILTSFGQTTPVVKQPNIVFIISDDHAFQAIGAYGGKLMPTPNIDRIAKEGAIFQNSFV